MRLFYLPCCIFANCAHAATIVNHTYKDIQVSQINLIRFIEAVCIKYAAALQQ